MEDFLYFSLFSDSTTEILGGYKIPGENGDRDHDIYVRIGEMVNLTCVISGTNDTPKEIFWYHDGKVSIKI